MANQWHTTGDEPFLKSWRTHVDQSTQSNCGREGGLSCGIQWWAIGEKS